LVPSPAAMNQHQYNRLATKQRCKLFSYLPILLQPVQKLQRGRILLLRCLHPFGDKCLGIGVVCPFISAQRVNCLFETLVDILQCLLLRLDSGTQRIVNDLQHAFETDEWDSG